MEHLIEWQKYQVKVAKYIRDYSIWLKEQGEVTTADDGPGGGTNPPPPPPPPPPGN